MDEKFRLLTESLHDKYENLLEMEPVCDGVLPSHIKGSGIYMFSESGNSLYVGRTRNVRQRYALHVRSSSDANQAGFAFKLAKNYFEIGPNDPRSRANLMQCDDFRRQFNEEKRRIRRMEFRFVNEENPTRQCLLEIYVTVVCGSPYNDFDTH